MMPGDLPEPGGWAYDRATKHILHRDEAAGSFQTVARVLGDADVLHLMAASPDMAHALLAIAALRPPFRIDDATESQARMDVILEASRIAKCALRAAGIEVA
jgi:hypothetical protein